MEATTVLIISIQHWFDPPKGEIGSISIHEYCQFAFFGFCGVIQIINFLSHLTVGYAKEMLTPHLVSIILFTIHFLSKKVVNPSPVSTTMLLKYKNQLQMNALPSISFPVAYTPYFHRTNKLAISPSYSVWIVQNRQFWYVHHN
jgi:hypothetical protein